MADNYKIYQKCSVCGGDGVRDQYDQENPHTIPCHYCNGTGLVFWGWILETEDTPPQVGQ